MGAALTSIIAEAERLAGLQGKLMLAGITRMTTAQANSATDTPQLVTQFKSALAEVHLGPARTWNADEERFAYLMAAFVSLAMERHVGPPRL